MGLDFAIENAYVDAVPIVHCGRTDFFPGSVTCAAEPIMRQVMTQQKVYGERDNTYQAAGGQTGIRKLVDCFFDIMGSDPSYQIIYGWHPANKEESRDKLALFLCGWMGGPKPFVEKYGPISIPAVHQHLQVTELERDLWLECMGRALHQQAYPLALIEYLLRQLFIPAERIRQACMGP
jgi:hemoglobin